MVLRTITYSHSDNRRNICKITESANKEQIKEPACLPVSPPRYAMTMGRTRTDKEFTSTGLETYEVSLFFTSNIHCGGGRIRTYGPLRTSSFQDWRDRPLCHTSEWMPTSLHSTTLPLRHKPSEEGFEPPDPLTSFYVGQP